MSAVRVVVVDDSAFSRRTITKMLEGIKDIEVIGFATNGEEGIQKVIALKPDLVTLDLEMPKMDGFTLLRILTNRFSMPVIVISALSGADNVFKALELGALDFIAKPSSTASADLLLIKEDLQQKVLQVFNHKPKGINRLNLKSPVEKRKNEQLQRTVKSTAAPRQTTAIDIVAIGSSTGGPPALQSIFSSFENKFPFAVVVSQHMPAGFTKAFADRLNRSSLFDIKEAEDGDPVIPGRILIAPGGMNMTFEVSGGQVTARIVPPASTDRYVPSVDVMLESCAGIYRNRMIAVILTGMGNDGSKGVKKVHENGGYVIAESAETAVVFGMPREAVVTGLVDIVVPLHRVAQEILVKGELL
ncbi:MAG: chemotaxis response regulator protein-glutamate methylesterase [Desulfobacteraceae bacterium]|nr:chemotaxis response regulator protein-glutamate methylesterase [Desulfobacteraceae bacterium]